jgi:hypothetical protein
LHAKQSKEEANSSTSSNKRQPQKTAKSLRGWNNNNNCDPKATKKTPNASNTTTKAKLRLVLKKAKIAARKELWIALHEEEEDGEEAETEEKKSLKMKTTRMMTMLRLHTPLRWRIIILIIIQPTLWEKGAVPLFMVRAGSWFYD